MHLHSYVLFLSLKYVLFTDYHPIWRSVHSFKNSYKCPEYLVGRQVRSFVISSSAFFSIIQSSLTALRIKEPLIWWYTDHCARLKSLYHRNNLYKPNQLEIRYRVQYHFIMIQSEHASRTCAGILEVALDGIVYAVCHPSMAARKGTRIGCFLVRISLR